MCRRALTALLLAAACSPVWATPPPVCPNAPDCTSTLMIGTTSTLFLAPGSTTSITEPKLRLAVDGTVGPGLRHNLGPANSVGNSNVQALWHLDFSTFSITFQSTVTLNGDPPGYGDPNLDLTLYCQNGGSPDSTCVPDIVPAEFNNGLTINGLTQPLGGVWNGAYVSTALFNGSANPDLGNLDAGSFTLELWTQFDANTNGLGTMAIAGKGNGTTTGYWIGVNNSPSPNNGRWTAFVGGTHLNGTVTDPLPQTGAFTFLALTFDPTVNGGTMSLYVDGRLAGQFANIGSYQHTAATNEFLLGSVGSHTAPVDIFKGAVDDVRYLNFASSQDQVVADYISGTARYSTDSGNTWNYILNPSTVSVTGADGTLVVDTISINGGFNFVDCSTQNLVAFLWEDISGVTPPSFPVYQVPVATEPAPAAVFPNGAGVLATTQTLTTSDIKWQWDVNPAAEGPGGALCTHQYAIVTTTATAPNGGEIVLTTVTANRNGATSFDLASLGPLYSLPPNFPMGIRIHSLNELGTGGTTTYAVVYTTANPPSGTHMVMTSSQSAQISWNANGNPSYTNYILSYGIVGGSTQTATSVGITTISLTGLATNQAYWFYTEAQDGNGYITSANPSTIGVSTITMQPFLGSMFNHNQSVHLSGWLQTRQFTIDIPPYAFPQDFYLIVNDSFTTLSCGLTGSQPISSAPGTGFPAFQFLVEPQMEPIYPATVQLTYAPGELAALGGNIKDIQMQRFDPPTNRCIPAVTQASLATVTGELNHMTVWQIVQATPTAATTLDAARVYPNPIYLRRPAEGYFIFDRIPPGTEAHIYTLRGERIWEGHANALGEMRWDAINSAGTQVASGLYFAVLSIGGQKKILKLGIER